MDYLQQPKKQRLFFALVPPESIKKDIIQFTNNFKIINSNVKVMPKEKLHITLFFLGDVDAAVVPKIVKNVKKIKLEPFFVHLDYLGYFSNSRVFWMGCNHIPKKLLLLVNQIEQALQQVENLDYDFIINKKNKYTPHVTLYKKLALGDITVLNNASPNLTWDINSFCLLRSKHIDNTSEYELVESFS